MMQEQYFQQSLPLNLPSEDKPPIEEAEVIRNNNNSISPEDRAFHDWYRFVLSFPPHLVRDYINDFELGERSLILDPFCGTGTTLVEAKLHGIEAVGLEANPFPHFASTIKTDWNIDPNDFADFARQISERTYADLIEQGIDDRALTSEAGVELKTLKEQALKALIKNSISPLPLHKSLTLLEQINYFQDTPFYKHSILALGNALIQSIGNLRFGPEVGVGKIKRDVPVVALWMHEIKKISTDLQLVYGRKYPPTTVFLTDARELTKTLAPGSVDAVITSPRTQTKRTIPEQHALSLSF